MGEPDSSSPSTNSVTPTGGRPVVGAQHGEVGHDAGLVVGGAAAVEAAGALGGLERRGRPQLVAAGRLDVVVGVEQHGRRAGRGGPVGDDRRGAAVRRDDPDVGPPAPAGQRGDGLGAAPRVVGVRGVGPDARDADEALEIGPRTGQNARHGGGEVGGQVVAAVFPARSGTAPMLRGPTDRIAAYTSAEVMCPDAGLAYRNAEVMCPDAGLALTWREFCVPVHELRVRARARAQRGTYRGVVGSRACPGSSRRCWPPRAGSPHGMTTGEPRDARPTDLARDPRHAARRAARRAGGGRASGEARPSACWPASPATIAPAAQAVWLLGGSVTMLHQPTARTDLAAWAEETVGVLKMIGAAARAARGALRRRWPRCSPSAASRAACSTTSTASPSTPTPTPRARTTPRCCSSPAARPPSRRPSASPTATCTPTSPRWSQAARLDTDRDVMVSWLPLFHDMGMVGFLTDADGRRASSWSASPRPTSSAGPLLWAELISRYGGTVTAAPNFAYAVLARQLARADDGSLDLSTLRFALNGAEPIDPAAVAAFTAAGARFGLRPEAVVCAYGMAETALGVSFAPVDTGLQVDEIDAVALEEHRRAVPAGDGRRDATLPAARAAVAGHRGPGRRRRRRGARRARGRGAAAARRVGDAGLPDGRRPGRDAGRRRLARHRRRGLPRRRRGRGLRPAQGRDHHGRPQHLPDRHRAGRVRGATGVRAGNAVAVRLEADGEPAPRVVPRGRGVAARRRAGGGAGDRART